MSQEKEKKIVSTTQFIECYQVGLYFPITYQTRKCFCDLKLVLLESPQDVRFDQEQVKCGLDNFSFPHIWPIE